MVVICLLFTTHLLKIVLTNISPSSFHIIKPHHLGCYVTMPHHKAFVTSSTVATSSPTSVKGCKSKTSTLTIWFGFYSYHFEAYLICILLLASVCPNTNSGALDKTLLNEIELFIVYCL